jgi:chorismate--pyruvate lyase
MTSNRPTVPDIADPALQWKPLEHCWPKPDPQWRSWLLDPGSLTQILVKKSEGDFRVELIEEGWVNGGSDALLDCLGPAMAKQEMWSRKVVLLGKGEPWVTAHTLVPRISLEGPLKSILELNDRPLGEFLFSHPELIRTGLELAAVPNGGWGRRSCFYLFDSPILVAEYFLPQLIAI